MSSCRNVPLSIYCNSSESTIRNALRRQQLIMSPLLFPSVTRKHYLIGSKQKTDVAKKETSPYPILNSFSVMTSKRSPLLILFSFFFFLQIFALVICYALLLFKFAIALGRRNAIIANNAASSLALLSNITTDGTT